MMFSTPTADVIAPDELSAVFELPMAVVPSVAVDRLRQGPVVLFGAGVLGQKVARVLRDAGIAISAFVADEGCFQPGQTVLDCPIVSPTDAMAQFGPAAVWVVCICSDKHRFLSTKERFMALGAAVVEPFLSIACAFSDALLPYYQYTLPQDTLAHREKIETVYNALADKESRRQFRQQVAFRLTCDYRYLPASSRPALPYFPDFIRAWLPDDVSFADCGCFNGDTTRDFLSVVGQEFSRVVAFEPDTRNEEVVQRAFSAYPPETSSRLICHQVAVAEHDGEMAFDECGTEGSRLVSTGPNLVATRSLDSVCSEMASPVYVKMDLEGAELGALKGATTLLRSPKAAFAVCVYHQPADLWELPLFILSQQPNRSLYYRIEGEDGLGSVLYAIPSWQGDA